MRSIGLLAAAAGIALTGALAHPQITSAQTAPADGQGPRGGMTHADFDALTDARIAGIQAGLKLNADQQKLWGPVEQALRGIAKTRAQRFEEFRAHRQGQRSERPDMMQMLEMRSERATQSADDLKSLTTALKPFWASLDDQQKKLLPLLMRPAGGRMQGWHRPRDGRQAPDQAVPAKP